LNGARRCDNGRAGAWRYAGGRSKPGPYEGEDERGVMKGRGGWIETVGLRRAGLPVGWKNAGWQPFEAPFTLFRASRVNKPALHRTRCRYIPLFLPVLLPC